MRDPDVKLLVFILLAVLVGGALWFFRGDIFPPPDEPSVIQSEPVAEEDPAPQAPIHPLVPAEITGSIEGELVPLPPLDDSDSYFLLALIGVFGSQIEPLLVNETLVDRFVATVDNLTRSHVAEKIRPFGRLSGTFVADSTGETGQYTLSSQNHQRYDFLVNMAAAADLDDAVAMYRRFYPLFQESYERLGYPDAYFNDRAVEVIDHLLATPRLDEPAGLIRPHVLYEFSEVELEGLSSGQKLMLRMGSRNAETSKEVLRELRSRIAASAE